MKIIISKILFSTRLIAEVVVVGIYSLILDLLQAIFYMLFPRKCKNISGDTVLVTGAARGIGRELALELSRQGCSVICVDVNAEGNMRTAQDIVKQGYKAQAYSCDIADDAAVEELAKKVGYVDILVNNAGIIYFEPFLKTGQSSVSKVLEINVASHFSMIRNFLPGMMERNKGHIVGIASIAGLMGLGNASLYSSSKFAVVGLMGSLADELRFQGRSNIKTSCVCPYVVRTQPIMDTEVETRVPALEVVDATREIVQGILQERSLFTVPLGMQNMINILRLLPDNTCARIRDVIYTRIHPSDARNKNMKVDIIKLLFWARLIAEIILIFPYSLILDLFKAIFYFVFPRKCKDIKGETVLVTGAAQGLGRELALQLSCLGCTVICVDVNAEGNVRTAQDIVKQGYKAQAYTCDIANNAAVEELAKKVGYVDILVNNAGLIYTDPFLKTLPSTVSKVLGVNVASHFLMIRNFLPGMIERNKGHIVGVASIAGLMSLVNASLYSSSKFAVVGLMTSLADELKFQGRSNIKTSCVCPYVVRTQPIMDTEVETRLPALEPEDAARVIVNGILQELSLFTIPNYMQALSSIARCLPDNTYAKLRDIIYVRIKPDDK